MYDYVPHKNAELVAWSVNFVSLVEANAAQWNISEEEVSKLKESAQDYASLFTQCDSPLRSPFVRAKRDAAARTLVAHIRALARFRLRNPAITDVQRVALGLPVRDSVASTIHAPSTHPEFHFVRRDVCRLTVSFRDMGVSNRARPYGMAGAIIAYAVLDEPPRSMSQLVRTVLATRTPYKLDFSLQDCGKTLYVAMCWQNRKGEKGPWSQIASAVIP
jgi:hypothetical protein